MRILWIGLALAAVAATGMAFEAGRRTESEYRTAVEALGVGEDFEARVASYERGLFGAEAVTHVGPAEPQPGEESVARLVLHHRIDHGPYPFSYLVSGEFDGSPILAKVTTRPSLELEDAEMIEEVALPLRLDALFTHDDGATLRISPDLEGGGLDDPELSADWQAIEGTTHWAYDGSSYAGRFEVPRFSYDGADGGTFHVRDLVAEFDYTRAGPDTSAMVGLSRFRLGLLTAGDADERFTLRGLEFESASQVSDGAWSLQVNGAFGDFEGDSGGFEGGELAFRVGGLAVAPLAELESVGPTIEAEGPGSDAVKAELMLAAGALWPQLMAPGPEVELTRLRVATPDGELRMAFRMGVDASDPTLLVHPMMTLPALEVDFELSLPEPLLEAWLAVPRPLEQPGALEAGTAPWVAPAELASRRVETWLERGHLDRHDGSYVTSIRMRRGALRLNGRVVSFDAL